MANISTYPIGTPSLEDLIPGTQKFTAANGRKENLTRNFTVSDLSSLATNNYVETTTTITNAQWLALGDAPVTLVQKLGDNKYIKLLEASIFFDFAVSNFSFTNSDLQIGFSGGNTLASLSGVASPVDADQVWTLALITPVKMSTGALVFRFFAPIGPANPTGGGTLQVKIRYQILDTSAF